MDRLPVYNMFSVGLSLSSQENIFKHLTSGEITFLFLLYLLINHYYYDIQCIYFGILIYLFFFMLRSNIRFLAERISVNTANSQSAFFPIYPKSYF